VKEAGESEEKVKRTVLQGNRQREFRAEFCRERGGESSERSFAGKEGSEFCRERGGRGFKNGNVLV